MPNKVNSIDKTVKICYTEKVIKVLCHDIKINCHKT